MAGMKPPIKRSHDTSSLKISSSKQKDALSNVALAAIVSSRKQKEVTTFIQFFLDALERNSNWLNNVVSKQNNFKCALLLGAGPNRFQLHEMIYPSKDENLKLEVELKENDDHDKFAIAAMLNLSTSEITHLMQYIKMRLSENSTLREDLLKGKSLGVSFAVLRPFSDRQYRVMERITIGSLTKCMVPAKKRRIEKPFIKTNPKKARPIDTAF